MQSPSDPPRMANDRFVVMARPAGVGHKRTPGCAVRLRESMATTTRALFVCSLSLSWPLAAIAEVSDKMNSAAMLPSVIVVGLLALAICWRWPKAAWVLFPTLCIVSGAAVFDDDAVLLAYRQEIGDEAFNEYRIRFLLSMSLMPLGALIGSALGMFRARLNPNRE